MIERIPEEMHVAALMGSCVEHLANGGAQAGMIVGDNKLNAVKASRRQAKQEVLP